MKNKNKVIILSSVLAAGAIAATAVLIPIVLNKNSKKTVIENKEIKNIQGELESKKENNSSIKNENQQSKKFKLSFKN